MFDARLTFAYRTDIIISTAIQVVYVAVSPQTICVVFVQSRD